MPILKRPLRPNLQEPADFIEISWNFNSQSKFPSKLLGDYCRFVEFHMLDKFLRGPEASIQRRDIQWSSIRGRYTYDISVRQTYQFLKSLYNNQYFFIIGLS